MTKPLNVEPTIDMDNYSRAEQMESLAQAIYEGDWTMRLEWRWDRAGREEQRVARLRAQAVMSAYEAGARTAPEFADAIASVEWTHNAGSAGRLRAQAEKVMQWFFFRDTGWLLNR